MDVDREMEKSAQRLESIREKFRKEETYRDELIRYAVISKKMSQAEAGRKVGVGRSRVNAIVKAK